MSITIHERLIDIVLQAYQKYNCGSTIFSILPSILFIVYAWLLAETYIMTIFLNHTNRRQQRRRGVPKISFGQYFLQNTLTLILVLSSGQCWSDGLLHYLNVYTIVILSMINNYLIPNYKMSQASILALESTCKMLVCFSVVYLIRWCYIYTDNKYRDACIRRRSRLRTIYNWRMQAHREMDELGENGYLLMQNTLPSEPDTDSVNSNTILRHTQSCQFPMKKTQTKTKIVERRKSV